jgi:serine/threonine protein kinase
MEFTEISLIGEGGFAKVWKVADENGKEWALKCLAGGHEKDKQRFNQEMRIQSSLSHDGIVDIVSASPASDPPYYVMLLAECSLEDRIGEFAADNESFIPIASQLINALVYAHDQKVVHRDIKPRNVLVYGDTVRISDFGLGKAIDIQASFSTTTGDIMGTWWYAPPEQYKGLRHCDERSDVYSLGKLMLHCLSGDRVNQIPSILDSRWKYVLDKCLKDDPDARWSGMQELKRRFELVFSINQPIVVNQEDLLAEIASIAASGSVSADYIATIAEKVPIMMGDESLLRSVVDNLPENLVKSWVETDEKSFCQLISAFDATLTDGLGFMYCDVVADQYKLFHQMVSQSDIREMLRARLFRIGPANNRWHVGGVFSEILETIRDPAEIASVIDLLDTDSIHAAWMSSYLTSSLIDKRIRDRVAEILEN